MNREVNFIDVNPRQIYEELISDFEEALGETLYPGDERRMFLQQQVPVIVAMKNEINTTGRQNLLSYATGSNLDSLGENMYNTKRLEPQKAYCTVLIKLTKAQQTEVIVPIGTRVTGDGALFFRLKNSVAFSPGELEKTSIVEAIETGRKYNGLIPGQLKTLVDPLPFVESIINTSITTGGADIEDDTKYRGRCRLSPESLSGAGPEGAYEYHAISADSTIVDAKVDSPSAGTVEISVLCANGEIPSQTVLDKVLVKCNNRYVRPLTDNVRVVAAKPKTYNIDLVYYLDREHAMYEQEYKKAIEGEQGAINSYVKWQQSELGKKINPDELRYWIQDAAVYYDSDKIKHSVVRRVVVTSPVLTEVTEKEVAKLGTINVVYGGLE